MKIFTLLFIFIMFFSSKTYAQDLIILTDQKEIQAKVVEIQEYQIKYKLWERIDGPIYNINKTDVFMIIYKSGEREFYNQQKSVANNSVNQYAPAAAPSPIPSSIPNTTPNSIPQNTNTDENNTKSHLFNSIAIATGISDEEYTNLMNTKRQASRDDAYYPNLGRINIGFGTEGPETTTIGLGLIFTESLSSRETSGGIELEGGLSYLYSESFASFSGDFSTELLIFNLGVNYGYLVSKNLKLASGLGYYYGTGTIVVGSEDEDISVNDIYYNVTADLLITRGFGFNVRYDNILGFNFGVSFRI